MLHNKTYYIVLCIFLAACTTSNVNQSELSDNSKINQNKVSVENKQLTEEKIQKQNSQLLNKSNEDSSGETVWKVNTQQEIKTTKSTDENSNNQVVINKTETSVVKKDLGDTSMQKQDLNDTSMQKQDLNDTSMQKKDLADISMEKKDLEMSSSNTNQKFNVAPITQKKFDLRSVYLSLDDVKDKKKSATLNLKKRYSLPKKQVATPNALVGNYLPVTRFLGRGGDIVDLSDYQGKKIILVILRGFAGGICLACSAQTLALSESVDKFNAKNTQIVLVYPGRAESIPVFISVLETLEEDYKAPFPIVLDVELELIKKLTIEGSLAKPTSMIVTTDGKIEYAYIGKGITDRPTVPTLLEEIDTLSQK